MDKRGITKSANDLMCRIKGYGEFLDLQVQLGLLIEGLKDNMQIEPMTPEEEQRLKDLGRWDLLEGRVNVIGQNGNDGEHYGQVTNQVDTINFDVPNSSASLDDGSSAQGCKQVGGDHYLKHSIQPWDIIDEYDLNFYEGNVLKYLLRRKGKRLEDLEKCRHYLDKVIEDYEE